MIEEACPQLCYVLYHRRFLSWLKRESKLLSYRSRGL